MAERNASSAVVGHAVVLLKRVRKLSRQVGLFAASGFRNSTLLNELPLWKHIKCDQCSDLLLFTLTSLNTTCFST